MTSSCISKAVVMAQAGPEGSKVTKLVTSEEEASGIAALKKQNEDNVRYV